MKTLNFLVLPAAFLAVSVWPSPAQQTPPVVPEVLSDGAGAKPTRVDSMHKTRFIAETTPYQPMTIARKSGVGWNTGTTVLLLDDAEGKTWVMKGFQLGLTPRYTYEEFVAAGAGRFTQLPPGWKFRVKTLERDLIERPEGGVATIMADEFFNVYDKTGPGMSNYKP